jgi:hypothetical protein
MTITYKEIEIAELNTKWIERTNEDGSVSVIPIDSGNSDYQRYLNPEAEQSTPIVINEAETI